MIKKKPTWSGRFFILFSYLCSMKSLIIISLLTLSTTAFSQNNPKTILALPKDTSKINLHLDKLKRVETTYHLLFAAGVVSSMVMYSLDQKVPVLFGVPLGLCLSGMGLSIYHSRLEDKYSQDSSN